MSNVQGIADRIMAMAPSERLRFAASLLDLGKVETARIVILTVLPELDATCALLAIAARKAGE